MLFRTNGALERMHVFGGWRPVFIINDSRRMNSVWGTETSFLLPHEEHDDVFMGVYFSGDCSDESLGSLRRTEIYDRAMYLRGDGKELKRTLVLAGRQLIAHSQIQCNSLSTADFNGRRAVFVEQEWLSTGQTSYQIFVDTLGDGRVIYNLMYVAPKNVYSKFFEQAKASFETSLWRTDFNSRDALRLLQDGSTED
ncbi:MAG: hypothetical protein DKT66_17115 [Candidatus Melainabacteria bacterium]|nr:MAG: hypothetical protein DKT66_17115 [Candidatus Melainabacteria bacterium]